MRFATESTCMLSSLTRLVRCGDGMLMCGEGIAVPRAAGGTTMPPLWARDGLLIPARLADVDMRSAMSVADCIMESRCSRSCVYDEWMVCVKRSLRMRTARSCRRRW